MRVTGRLMMQNFLSDLNAVQERLLKLQQQTATGKAFEHPQDNPAAVATSLNLSGVLAFMEQYNRNIDDGNSRLSYAETTLSDVNQELQRVRELTVQGSNTYLTHSDRDAIASEVDELLNATSALANSRFRGNYIFSGWETLTKAFDLNYEPGTQLLSSVTYRGDLGGIGRNIQVDQDMEINFTGKDVFLEQTYALTGKQLADGPLGFAGTISINGRSFLIAATDTLTDIRDRINSDPACEVVASIDESFVMKLQSLNSSEAIDVVDESGSVLEDMGLLPMGAYNLARTGPTLPLVDSTGAIHNGAALAFPLTIDSTNDKLVVRLGPNANEGANEAKALTLMHQTYNSISELVNEVQQQADSVFGKDKIIVRDGGGFLQMETFVQKAAVLATDFQLGGTSDDGVTDTASVLLGLTVAGGPELADFAGTDGTDRMTIDLGASAWRGDEARDPLIVEININAAASLTVDDLVSEINLQIDKSPDLSGLVQAVNDGGRVRLETFKTGTDVLGTDLVIADAAAGTLAAIGLSPTPQPAYIQGTVAYPPGVTIVAGVNDSFSIDLGAGSSIDNNNPPAEAITLTPGVYNTIAGICAEINYQIAIDPVLRGMVNARDDGTGQIILETTKTGSSVQADDLVLADVTAGTLAGLGLAGATVPGGGSSDGLGQIDLPDNVIDTLLKVRDALRGYATGSSTLVDLLNKDGSSLGMFAASTIHITANGTTSDFHVRRFTSCDELAAELEQRLGYGIEVRVQADGRFYIYNPTTTTVTGISVTVDDPAGNPISTFNQLFSAVTGNLVPKGELKSESFWEDERFIDLTNRLGDLDRGSETIISYVSQIGARTSRLTRTQDQNGTIIQNLTELQSANDDVDIAGTITELKSLETVLQAALGTGSQVIQQTLFDYLY